jgi:hypothetical protein
MGIQVLGEHVIGSQKGICFAHVLRYAKGESTAQELVSDTTAGANPGLIVYNLGMLSVVFRDDGSREAGDVCGDLGMARPEEATLDITNVAVFPRALNIVSLPVTEAECG